MTPSTTSSAPASPVFSTEAEFELRLRQNGPVTVTRFPTDQEWCDRSRTVKTIIMKAGAGTRNKAENVEEADAALLAKITVGAAPVVDEFEANALIGKLVKADAREAVSVPEGYTVTVHVVGGIRTTHTLRIPSEKAMRLYRRGAFTFIDLRHGKQELKTNPAAIGEFYDSLLVGCDGYAVNEKTAVPLVHKIAAVVELTQTVDGLDDEEDFESFI